MKLQTETQYKHQFLQLYNNERKINGKQIVTEQELKPSVKTVISSLEITRRDSTQAADINSLYQKTSEMFNEIDDWKNDLQQQVDSPKKKNQGKLMKPLIEEYEKGIQENESDWRVAKLNQEIQLRSQELASCLSIKRSQDHDLYQLRTKVETLESRITEMNGLSNELASENQKLRLKVEFVQKVNSELEKMKIIGIDNDQAIEMMRQIGAYK